MRAPVVGCLTGKSPAPPELWPTVEIPPRVRIAHVVEIFQCPRQSDGSRSLLRPATGNKPHRAEIYASAAGYALSAAPSLMIAAPVATIALWAPQAMSAAMGARLQALG
jgi:hypothetical protein